MAEKKTKKSKKTTNKTTKQKQSQKQTQKTQQQSVVVNVNNSGAFVRRKKRTTEVSSGRGNYVGRNISSGVPNNVIVHNNIDTSELIRVLRPEPTAQLQPIQIQEKSRVQEKPPIIPPIYRPNSNATQPIQIQEKSRVQEKPPIIPPIYRPNSNATLPLNIEPLQHNTPQPITFNTPKNTTPFVFEDRATPVAKNTRQQTKQKRY